MMFHTGEIFSELDIATYYCVLRGEMVLFQN